MMMMLMMLMMMVVAVVAVVAVVVVLAMTVGSIALWILLESPLSPSLVPLDGHSVFFFLFVFDLFLFFF